MVAGGGVGMDSSEDVGAGRKQVRFKVKDFDVADRLNGSPFAGKSFGVAGVDVADVEGRFEGKSFEFAGRVGCACCLHTCLVCVATIPSMVTAWYPSHDRDDGNDDGNDDALTTNNHNNNTSNGNTCKSDTGSD